MSKAKNDSSLWGMPMRGRQSDNWLKSNGSRIVLTAGTSPRSLPQSSKRQTIQTTGTIPDRHRIRQKKGDCSKITEEAGL